MTELDLVNWGMRGERSLGVMGFCIVELCLEHKVWRFGPRVDQATYSNASMPLLDVT